MKNTAYNPMTLFYQTGPVAEGAGELPHPAEAEASRRTEDSEKRGSESDRLPELIPNLSYLPSLRAVPLIARTRSRFVMERRTVGGSVFYPQMPELVPDLSYLFPEQSKAAPSAASWQQARLCSVDCHGLTCPGCQCRQPPIGCRSGSGSENPPPQRRRCSRSLPSSICPSLRICTRQIRYASLSFVISHHSRSLSY